MRATNTAFTSRCGLPGHRLALAALVLTGALGLGLAGCAGKHANDPRFVPEQNRAAELARAQRLQEQAFNAQKDKEFARAIELYDQALQIDSGLGAAWHNMGTCLMEEKRYVDSRFAFQRAAELLPTDPRPYENIGVLYLERLGHARQAYDAYGQALERDPYSRDALRGSAWAIRLLRMVSTDAQSRLARGLEVETDTRWREVMNTERIRVDAGLREEARR